MAYSKRNRDKKEKERNKNRRKRKLTNWTTILIATVIIFYIVLQLFTARQELKPTAGDVSLQEMYNLIDEDKVDTVIVNDSSNKVTLELKDGTVVNAVNPKNDTFIYDLLERGANVQVQKSTWSEVIMRMMIGIPYIMIISMIVIYISNTTVGGSTKMFTLLKPEQNKVTFDQVKGLGETKKNIQFIVDQFNNSEKLDELGARACKGVLLYGPPGTGKTLMAKAIANEANVPFISAAGSDFGEMFVGVGAARVRSLCSLAQDNAPCIVFIDEIDCLGRRRSVGGSAEQDSNQTLNALLQKMDGINGNTGVLFIAATNRLGDLDDALLRPGRFDRQVYIGPPSTKKDRDEIVDIYLKNKKLDEGVTLDKVSKLLVGLTGAQIEESLNEAVYVSLQDGRNGVIELSDIDEAVMRQMTKGVRVEHSSKRDTEITAIHEAGHTVVNLLHGLPVSKVSIIPYSSGAGGMTVRDADFDEDQKLKLESDLTKEIDVLLAGMLAEGIKFNEHTQGCSNDLEQVTNMTYNMITKCGFSNKPSKHRMNEEILVKNHIRSEVSKETIDECNEYIEEREKYTRVLLEDNFDLVEALANKLIEKKTIVSPTLDEIESWV